MWEILIATGILSFLTFCARWKCFNLNKSKRIFLMAKKFSLRLEKQEKNMRASVRLTSSWLKELIKNPNGYLSYLYL